MKAIDIRSIDFESSLLPWLGNTTKALQLHMNDVFERHGISISRPQFILLKNLKDKDGVPQRNLAFITNRDKATLARLVQAAEKKGLVKRKPAADDKRMNLVFITQKGKEVLIEAMPILLEMMESIQSDLTTKEVEITLSVLKKIGDKIEAEKLIRPLYNS